MRERCDDGDEHAEGMHAFFEAQINPSVPNRPLCYRHTHSRFVLLQLQGKGVHAWVIYSHAVSVHVACYVRLIWL